MAEQSKMVKVKVTSGKHHVTTGEGTNKKVKMFIAGDGKVLEVTRNTYERMKDKFALVSAEPLEKVPEKKTTQTRRDNSKKDDSEGSSRSRTIGNL